MSDGCFSTFRSEKYRRGPSFWMWIYFRVGDIKNLTPRSAPGLLTLGTQVRSVLRHHLSPLDSPALVIFPSLVLLSVSVLPRRSPPPIGLLPSAADHALAAWTPCGGTSRASRYSCTLLQQSPSAAAALQEWLPFALQTWPQLARWAEELLALSWRCFFAVQDVEMQRKLLVSCFIRFWGCQSSVHVSLTGSFNHQLQ